MLEINIQYEEIMWEILTLGVLRGERERLLKVEI
jgi:hypothetical protein